ncbi:uncharacterized protein BDZ99DRAFT_493110 [Mytilinidion resinicola]|uniref:Uncharacterized protein n=1 Tax=Mytilinidion resinicola TaxID=574789 RepID=A0A6A6ZAM0_9PEZI|nr:uncharacterized protein BDZ99DRAFT_493110 [Mytilinidion resinicola]KAF2817257.1 hypothetical protein BDZ99DRAFT_493110 [Mytilinidion resinicola]
MAPHRLFVPRSVTNRYSPYKAATKPARSLTTKFSSRSSPVNSSKNAPEISTNMTRDQDVVAAAAPNKALSLLMGNRPLMRQAPLVSTVSAIGLPTEIWLEIGDFLGLFPPTHKQNPHASRKRDKALDANSDVCGMESTMIKNLKRAHNPRISRDIDILLARFLLKSTFAAYFNNTKNIGFIRTWFNDIGDAQDPAEDEYGVNCIRDIVFWTGIRITPCRDYDSYVRIRVVLDKKESSFKITTNAPRYQEEQTGKMLGQVLEALTQYLDASVRKRFAGYFYLDLSDWQAILKILVHESHWTSIQHLANLPVRFCRRLAKTLMLRFLGLTLMLSLLGLTLMLRFLGLTLTDGLWIDITHRGLQWQSKPTELELAQA